MRPRSLRPSSCTDTGDAPGARALPLQAPPGAQPSLSPPQRLALCQARLEVRRPPSAASGPPPAHQGGRPQTRPAGRYSLLKSRAWLHLLPGTVILSAGPASTQQSKGRRELVQTPGTHTCHRGRSAHAVQGERSQDLGWNVTKRVTKEDSVPRTNSEARTSPGPPKRPAPQPGTFQG